MQKFADIQEKVLTDAQNAAIYSIDRPMAVVAGAGSGKTTVLINRCRHIIGDDWSEIDRLLAITFTEKAAGELKARLRPFVPLQDHHRIEGSWIGTFHSCCARMLRQHAPVLGLDPAFHILDENAAKLLAGQAVKNTLLSLLKDGDENASSLVDAVDFRTSIGALEDLMSFRWHARRALKDSSARDANDSKIVDALSAVFEKIEDNLDSRFIRLGALDFQGLEIRALELLNEHDEILDYYRRKFRHILVDEFQDTNDAQTELVLKLFEPSINRICIVGDPRQSIYRFRGANIDCFTKALGHIRRAGGESTDLLENFRSRPKIVQFINLCQETLADGLFGSLTRDDISAEREEMIATRPDEGRLAPVVQIPIETGPKAQSLEMRNAEAKAIASYISHLVSDEKVRLGDIVCLFQALTGISPYEKAFRIAGIPYLIFGGRGLLNRQEISDLLAALIYASDPEDEMALLCLLRSPLIGLSDDDLVMMAGEDGGELVKNARSDPRCGLLEELPRMAEHLRPSEILCRTLSLTGYEQVCHKLDSSGGMTANIDRFISLAASIERQEPAPLKGFNEFIGELKTRSARIGDPPAVGDTSNALRCMTVHAAKGLEFPVVIIPDLFRKMKVSGGKWQFTREHGIAFKLKNEDRPLGAREETDRYKSLHRHDIESSIAESKRLLYVAMTRAKEQLVLPIHSQAKNVGPWHDWIAPMVEKACLPVGKAAAEGIIASWEPPSQPSDIQPGQSSGPRSNLHKRGNGGPAPFRHPGDSFTVSQLECFYRCPREYYLKYVLALPPDEIFKGDADKLPANIFGSIVHGILERYTTATQKELDAMIRTSCIANSVIPEANTIKSAKRIIETFERNALADAIDEGFREVRFDWKFGDATITGSIDWLKPASGGFEIVDFKTDHVGRGAVVERAAEYDLQLTCYALAAEAALGKRIEGTVLHFLMPNETHRTPMSDERRVEGKSLIESILDSIRNERFDLGGKKTPCFKCPYRHNRMCWKVNSL